MAKLLKDLVLNSFEGMNNKALRFLSKSPYFLHNLDIYPDLTLRGRRKLEKIIDLPNAHSPFSIDDRFYLCASFQSGQNKLYFLDIKQKSSFFICDCGSVNYRLFYVKVGDRVYISNIFWNGILNIKNLTIREWRLDRRFTFSEAREASDYVFAEAMSMPKVDNIVFFKGRICGSRENKLWFTQAIFMDFTYPWNFYEFDEPIVQVLANDDIIIISSENRTWVGSVVNSEKFILNFEIKDIGAIKGSGVRINNTLLWLSNRGLVMADKEVIEITKDVLNVSIDGEAISGKTYIDGSPQYLAGGSNVDIDFKDDFVVNVIKKSNEGG